MKGNKKKERMDYFMSLECMLHAEVRVRGEGLQVAMGRIKNIHHMV
jgi:hypothetical protein